MIKKSEKKNGKRWFPIPKELIRDYSTFLGSMGISVYCILAAYADNNQLSHLSFRKISRKLGCTNAEAVRALHQLEELHIIKSETDNGTNAYLLLWVPSWV